MKTFLCVGFVACAAAVLAPVAGARDVTLKRGDVVAIPGTNIVCLYEQDTRSGKLEMGCVLIKVGGILPSSWGVGLLVDGTAEVVQFDAKGQSAKTKFRRPLGVERRSTTYKLAVGDHFAGAGTKITCAVQRNNGVVTVGCLYRLANKKAATNEFAINRKAAAVYSVVPATLKTKALYVKTQPRG
jgi:hypothetical protein